ncbi:MAG: Ppx/GppA family phosphatase [Nocardioides sp.]|nr:Ppx/GppA family phosphatase [Nocardioides sp.]
MVEVRAQRASRPTVAAIDCGTNTIKLLVGAPPAVEVREVRMVRLGEGVDRTGRLSEAALQRTFAAVDDYARIIAEHDVDRVRFCATSASRDAENSAEFVAGVRARLGVEPEVVTGTEEAALAFDGAVRALQVAPAAPVLVIDVGGGSTELILGDVTPSSACSMNIGSVRLHERHLRSDPPSMAEVTACVRDIDTALAACPVDIGAASTLVGVAGTVTTIAAGVLDLATYDRAAIDQATLSLPAIHDVVDRLVRMTVAERLALPYMHPGRADVIVAGALILQRVLRRSGVTELVVSEADILDGIAWSLVG